MWLRMSACISKRLSFSWRVIVAGSASMRIDAGVGACRMRTQAMRCSSRGQHSCTVLPYSKTLKTPSAPAHSSSPALTFKRPLHTTIVSITLRKSPQPYDCTESSTEFHRCCRKCDIVVSTATTATATSTKHTTSTSPQTAP